MQHTEEQLAHKKTRKMPLKMPLREPVKNVLADFAR